MGTKELRALGTRAESRGLGELADACGAELDARGSLQWDADTSKRHFEWEKSAKDLDLAATIRLAFTEAPESEAESKVTRILAESPGISHAGASKVYGNGHLNLVMGHMVHDRLGFFRHLLEGNKQSDILIERTQSTKGVTYRLKPEFEAVMRERGVI